MPGTIDDSSNPKIPESIDLSEVSKAQLQAAAAEQAQNVKIAAMQTQAVNQLTQVQGHLIDAYNKQASYATPAESAPKESVATTTTAPVTATTSVTAPVSSTISSPGATALVDTFNNMTLLVQFNQKLTALLNSTHNQSALTVGQSKNFNHLTTQITNTREALETSVGQIDVDSPIVNSIKSFLQGAPPPGESAPLSQWKSYIQASNAILNDPHDAFGQIQELANKKGVNLEAADVKFLVGSDDSTDIQGNIEKWILGNMMSELYGKVARFQNSISRNADFLDILGPMELFNENWQKKFDFHLPPTPRDQHVQTWKHFLDTVMDAISPNAIAQFKAKMLSYIHKLSALADKNPPNQKLMSLVKALSSHLNKETAALDKFIKNRGDFTLDFLFYLMKTDKTPKGGLTPGQDLKTGARDRFEAFLSQINGFGKVLKDDGATVQSTNTTDQSQLQLQLNFLQEFMQAGPTLIQTLNELMRAIAQNMKGQ